LSSAFNHKNILNHDNNCNLGFAVKFHDLGISNSFHVACVPHFIGPKIGCTQSIIDCIMHLKITFWHMFVDSMALRNVSRRFLPGLFFKFHNNKTAYPKLVHCLPVF